ncbi:MAG: hypothetical protein JWN60_3375 [Acidobacteria bacterium]|nr:hypothetical protein [Acidobacteriota bacterium]
MVFLTPEKPMFLATAVFQYFNNQELEKPQVFTLTAFLYFYLY